MKKTVAIVAMNLLVAGGLSARAGWMILSGCDIGGTCRGTSGLLTWGLAIGPAVLLLVVLGLSVPKLLAANAVRREEKSQMKAERAEVQASDEAESEQGKSRLARLKRPVAEADVLPESLEDESADNAAFAAGAAQPDLDRDDLGQPDWVSPSAEAGLPHSADAYAPADNILTESASRPEYVQADAVGNTPDFKFRDMDAIEREWQAAEAMRDPAETGYMSEPTSDRDNAPDWGPVDPVAAPAADSAPSLPAFSGTAANSRLAALAFDAPDGDDFDVDEPETDEEESPAAYASLADVVDPQGAGQADVPDFDAFDPVESAASEPHGWQIGPAEAPNPEGLPVPDWAVPEVGQSYRAAAGHEPVDIWARTTLEGMDENDAPLGTEVANAPERFETLSIEPVAEDYPAIDLPGIGRAPAQWDWLFADGLPLLRTSKATGFPWIAGGIGEVATAIHSAVDMRNIGAFEAEADAWVRIARSIPYAEPLAVEDAQGFVEWCNALSVDLAASNQQDAFCQAVSNAMAALRGRARNDMETSLALPDAFDDTGGSGFGHSLTG